MNPHFNLESYFKDCRDLINKELESTLPKKETFPSRIHEAMRYSLFAGGKRIRPILCLAASEACGGGRRAAIPIACALEMIHTFSLVHDDLPAMDDDSLRRGVPTNHTVFDEATAILAGDGLAIQAFIVLGKLTDTEKSSRVLEIIHDISMATGSLGMIGGQILDMQAEGKKISVDELKKLHELKTGRLIAASVTSGAKLVSESMAQISALEHYGELIGLAFQIADDILDIEGGEELGKDIGSDVANGKSTYPALMGLEEARKMAFTLRDEAINSLRDFGPEADALRAIADYIVRRKS